MLEELKDGKVVASNSSSSTSILGLDVKEITRSLRKKYGIEDEDGKLVIVSVDSNSEAADKGLREGDIIKRVGLNRYYQLKNLRRKSKSI